MEKTAAEIHEYVEDLGRYSGKEVWWREKYRMMYMVLYEGGHGDVG